MPFLSHSSHFFWFASPPLQPPSAGLRYLPSEPFAQPIAPPGRPSLSGQNMNCTLSPGLNVSPVMPREMRPVGAEPSKLQSVVEPSGFLTFTNSHECGLLNAQRCTVPLFTSCVSRSNIANE